MSAASDTPSRRLRDMIERARSQAEAIAPGLNGRIDPWDTGSPARRGSFAALPVDWLPGYELLDELHRGGQGVVYHGIQKSTSRRVAIKVMREGPFAGAADRARFEREAQILGQLNHPNIVAIHDCGTAAQCHYFVMDLIDGQPLDAWILDSGPRSADLKAAGRTAPGSSKRQSPKSRIESALRLFASICDAVHAAHLRGVIHRDLKPGNIRVDRSGQPHILDFGLAKLTDGSGAVADLTRAGQFMGSLPWASPEQAAGEADKLDLRTDVYSLGVILFQTLTGSFPYDIRGSLRDVLDRIQGSEPIRPGSLCREVDDELDTIILKCLSKEPERRYQGAGELAADIRHYLAGEPIAAKRDSGWYMLRKGLSRHRLPVGAAASFVLLLAVFAFTMAAARLHAQREAEKYRQVLAFLQNMLADVHPDDAGREGLTVRAVLDQAAARLDRELVDQPEVAASVHQTLGNQYGALGLYLDADRQLRKAVALRRGLADGDDPELAAALVDFARNLHEKRELLEAEAPLREALAMRRRRFGEGSLEVARSSHALACLLIDIAYREAAAVPRRDSHDALPLPADAGRAQEAEQLARESLEIFRRLLGEQHADVAESTGLLGWSLLALGRTDEARMFLRDSVESVRRLPGDNELLLAGRLTYVALLLRDLGDLAGEEAALREAIDIRSRRLAPDHPALAWNLICLAQVRRKLGDLVEAEATCRRALDIYQKERGSEDEDIANCQQVLAQIHDARGQHAEAERCWSACLALRRNVLPAEHPDIAFAEKALAEILAVQQRASKPQP
jgi:serine/threonine protein kinase/tetratricopeptide (TPR) repeat protein